MRFASDGLRSGGTSAVNGAETGERRLVRRKWGGG